MAEHADTERSLEPEPTEYSLVKDNHSMKRAKEKERPKITQHQHSAAPSHKPPSGQHHRSRQKSTGTSAGLLNSAVSFNTSEQTITDIPRSRHISSPQPPPGISRLESSSNEDRSESSLALSDQMRHHSSRLRDAVFAEWLAEKGSHMKKEREELQLKKKKQEQAKVEKIAAREAKIADSLQQWTEKKSASLKSVKQKQKQEEEAKKEEELKKLEKVQESEEAAKKWRKEQVMKLVKERRSKKMEQDKRDKAKNEEMEEKADGAIRAFKAWSEKKDKDRSKIVKQRRSEVKQNAQLQAENRETRMKEAASAFQAWKAEKDKKLKSTGSLYTYNVNPRQPPKNKWCPARSVKYSYPFSASNKTDKRKSRPPSSQSARSRKSQSDTQSVKSYNSSFESDHENSVVDASREEDRAESSSEQKGQQTGTIKRVQVCCQTVEFLCTCGQ